MPETGACPDRAGAGGIIGRVHTFAEAARLDPALVGPEAARLAALGDRVAPGFVLGADFEEDFYVTNNLPEQLRALFAPVNPRRIDEDALEVLCDKAVALLRASYLLDDSVQLFLRAVNRAGLLGGEAHARRALDGPGEGPGGGAVESAFAAPPGSALLVAVKKLWARDWTFDAVLDRLDTHGRISLDARPVLVFAGPPGRAEPGGTLLANERGVVGAR